jgi:hypothetical protein
MDFAAALPRNAKVGQVRQGTHGSHRETERWRKTEGDSGLLVGGQWGRRHYGPKLTM